MRRWRYTLGMALTLLVSADVFAGSQVVVTTTDYSSGSLAVVDMATYAAQVNLLNLHGDTAVRGYRGMAYIINRKGQDNVIVLDPANPTVPVRQFSVGNGTNPQDIAFASETRAYVARLENPRLLVVNPATGDSLGSIDLSFAADADGFPEAAYLAVYGNHLYVTCQRLDQNAYFAPTDRSEVVVVDMTTDTVVDMDAASAGLQGIVLQAKNPFVQVTVGSRLYLSCTGSFGAMDGGVEVVDLETDRTEGVVIGEAELGGDVGALALVSDTQGYVVVSDASFVNSVKRFNLRDKQVLGALSGISGGYVPSMAALRGRLYVADQGSTGAPETVGLRVYDTATGVAVAGPISTGLPPSAIAFVEGTSVADFDGDGDVDFSDFLALAAAYNASVGDANYNAKIDLDGDGGIGFADFLQFAAEYGR